MHLSKLLLPALAALTLALVTPAGTVLATDRHPCPEATDRHPCPGDDSVKHPCPGDDSVKHPCPGDDSVKHPCPDKP